MNNISTESESEAPSAQNVQTLAHSSNEIPSVQGFQGNAHSGSYSDDEISPDKMLILDSDTDLDTETSYLTNSIPKEQFQN